MRKLSSEELQIQLEILRDGYLKKKNCQRKCCFVLSEIINEYLKSGRADNDKALIQRLHIAKSTYYEIKYLRIKHDLSRETVIKICLGTNQSLEIIENCLAVIGKNLNLNDEKHRFIYQSLKYICESDEKDKIGVADEHFKLIGFFSLIK